MSSIMDPIMNQAAANDSERQLTICEIFDIRADSFEKIFYAENHYEIGYKSMKTFFDNQQLCDVNLIAGTDGERISAHRVVLAASSKYFWRKFQQSAPNLTLDIQKITGPQLRKMLNFCYTGEMELLLDDMDKMLDIAYHFELQSLVSIYNDHIYKYLRISNCLRIASAIKHSNNPALIELVEKYMLYNFMEIHKDPSFLVIDVGQLKALLSNDDLAVDTEEDVFHAIMMWINHSPSERMQLFPDLLKLIRFGLLETIFIMNNIGPLCSAYNCSELVLNALKHRIMFPAEVPKVSCARHASVQERILVMAKNESNQSVIGEYCPFHGVCTWMPVDVELNYCVTIATNNMIFIAIPKRTIHTNLKLQLFDIKTKSVTLLSNMLNPDSAFCFAILQDVLYAIGGQWNRKRLNTVERYSIENNAWTYATPMIEERAYARAAVLNDILYVVGGNDYVCTKTTMESYSTATNLWTPKSDLLIGRRNIRIIAGNRFLYVLGGTLLENSLNSVERYDPNTDKWTQICSLSTLMGPVKGAMLGNRLFAIKDRIVEEYDIKQNKWKRRDPLEYSAFAMLSTRCTKLDKSCEKCNQLLTIRINA